MKMMKLRYIWYLIMMGAVTGCKKPYNPAIVSSPNHYLVVEGVINTGSDPTVISISQTVNLGESVQSAPQAGYTVSIQDEAGNPVAELLSPLNNGKYSSTGALNLDPSKKYRLHIANTQKVYESDYIAVKNTPAIDSIGFVPTLICTLTRMMPPTIPVITAGTLKKHGGFMQDMNLVLLLIRPLKPYGRGMDLKIHTIVLRVMLQVTS
jgi:hypothetical protein